MALAYLEILGYENGNVQFKLDAGKNKYYQILIGENQFSNKGLPAIENVSSSSKVFGPLGEDELGRKDISLPQNVFDKTFNKIQLVSFRDKNKIGIAVSEVISVKIPGQKARKETGFSISKNVDMRQESYLPTIHSYNTSFSLQENKMSNSMFFAALLPLLGNAVKGLLPGLLNSAPKILNSLLGGATAPQAGVSAAISGIPVAAGAPTAQPVSGNALLQLLNSPEVTALLQNLLQQTLNAGSASPAAVKAKSLQLKFSNTQYSEAKIAPALLAALPALMPLLQQILSPETIGKVLEQPQKMIGAVTDGIVKLGELGIASHEQDLQHLRALNPGTGPAVDSLLESMSMAIIESNKLIAYQLIKSVKIKFANVVTVDCEGKNCLLYNYGSPIMFPVEVATPKPIGNCIVQLSIKDVQSSKVLLIKNFKYKVASDLPAGQPLLEPGDYQTLMSNNDYLVCISLIFKNTKKENIGAYASEVIHFSNSHLFAAIKSKGAAVPLNDIQIHRAFWHKIWQTKFSKQIMRLKIQLKYYCVLTSEKEGVGKMETVTKEVKTEDQYEQSMFLKTGIKINIADLNKLIPMISANSMLQENQLNALRGPDFLSYYNTLAQDVIKINGFENEIAMVWVFPELSFHELVLKKINKTNDYGMVTELVNDLVQFPIPTSVYFIATKNK